jgi:hypothetical protein
VNVVIPRLFHWIWFGDTPLPEQHRSWIQGWLNLHPGWKHVLWTEENRPQLVNEQQFQRAETYAQRSDIARFEIVYRYGGIYVDTDFECLRNIEPLLEGVEAFIVAEEPESLTRLGTGIIGATPHHAWLQDLIAEVPASMDTGFFSIVEETGPRFATRMTVGRSDVAVFPESLFRHKDREPLTETYAIHRGAGSWLAARALRYEDKLRELVFEDIEPVVPEGALFVLVDKGNELPPVPGGRLYVPFPERDGAWAGYPASDADAIAELQRLRARGARFVVFPRPMFYWLNAYPGLADYLRARAAVRVDNPRALIYELP